MYNTEREKRVIDNLLAILVVFASITGWYSLDYIGMNKFWLIFILCSLVLMFLIIRFSGGVNELIYSIKEILTNKLNLIIGLLLIWTAITYFINYTGKGTLLYVIKMWFLVVIYILFLGLYFIKQSKEQVFATIFTIGRYIFALGCINTLVAFYQFIYRSNRIFGIVISQWPTYNPASFYDNVNGLGTYLYISIIAGLILLVKSNKKRFYLVGIILQCYALYLTIARTSIISVSIFAIFAIITLLLFDRKTLRSVFTKRFLIFFIIGNLLGLIVVFNVEVRSSISQALGEKKVSINAEDRSITDMLKEKNDKGVNQRQFIWKAVINNKGQYAAFGDGLKYKVIEKINVAKVISSSSAGADRISYHNTLFRYFASHGFIGLILFLVVMAFAPITLIFRMIINRRVDIPSILYIIFTASIFAYMQMEEVYIGEIGMIQLINMINLTLGGYLVRKKEY
ncbi:O-antigen ligase family protein [Clostridium fallax]|uniref:O-Antigen ligase n=1 Tax=Clostridium fallax TaxID=1533 RepID=A0A1M4VQ91_9CLOT|nr:O-antigen ligase family protein [Clostridium fallax]SHE71035.1 O-Antigen ligase [Clostridium fallax]SQB22829.1 Lipid A core - O-antigen ligase and related enzymes [Clostridium fallax]